MNERWKEIHKYIIPGALVLLILIAYIAVLSHSLIVVNICEIGAKIVGGFVIIYSLTIMFKKKDF